MFKMPLENFDALLVPTAKKIPIPSTTLILQSLRLSFCVWCFLDELKMLLFHICNCLAGQRYVLLHDLVLLHFPSVRIVSFLFCRKRVGCDWFLSRNFCQSCWFHWNISHSTDSIAVGAMFVRAHFSLWYPSGRRSCRNVYLISL